MHDDEARLRALYQEHGGALVRRLTKLLGGDRHLAEDVLQETAVRAWRHPDARGPDGEWRPQWLHTVARNLAVDRIRAARRAAAPAPGHDDRPDPRDDIDRMLTGWQMRAAIARLPDRLRVTLIEVHLRGRSAQETADRLGVPVGTVKSRLFYAMRSLRTHLARRD
ncbi:RNA polymerase sigma-70 factor (ECF subfamily) [Catenuloplanes nepalensis]|uniref:RNA polymerase sigma-70 factor (ECF subfamily) n=1 Tax=Catenuloplanes nepalensis TaxID=587533 RepID=A0ABT9MXG0_9ACTN|nr:sigma-70 family RNA polymerase sigma factor [Catenuloplanes nepalensis]MDP9796121.1 RNA polymerase sigma-70 factor (ECF subfamily) [Catenuloplanes nepalensis]